MTNPTPLGRAVAQRVRDLPAAPSAAQDPETSTSAAVRAAVAQAMAAHQCDHYTRRPGIAPLCRQVAASLGAAGLDIDGDDGVVIAGGPQETRFVTVRTLAPDGTLYVPAGAGNSYAAAAALANASVTEYDEGTTLGSVAGVWIWQPGTGPAQGAVDAGATVVADLLASDAGSLDDLAQLAAHVPAEQLLILGDFGPNTGLDAWNVAWFAGPKALVAKVRTLKQAMTICTPAPGQYAALAVMEGASA